MVKVVFQAFLYYGCVWVPLILLKIENNKKIIWLLFTLKNTVHMPCPMNSASSVGPKKKRKRLKRKTSKHGRDPNAHYVFCLRYLIFVAIQG